jgi:hypothetical protein
MKTTLAILILIAALTFGHHHARAADSTVVYPTVKELEAGLGYPPGALLKQAPVRGHGWSFYYVHTRALGNGEYDVRVRLR